MTRHVTALMLVTAVALMFAVAGQAKGPSKASIEGPGLNGAIVYAGNGEDGGSTLGVFTQEAGFFPATFDQIPSPMLPGRPRGNLGPRYTVTYTVPGPNGGVDTIRQHLYPYAQGGPVTYMAAGQRIFESQHTRGGWFQTLPTLKRHLVEAGLPESPPVTTGDGSTTPDNTWVIAVAVGGTVLVVLLAAAIVVVRRRPQPAL
jgi:hypothetical protein